MPGFWQPEYWWVVFVLAVAVGMAVAVLLWRPLRAARRQSVLAQARKLFTQRREWLEAKFFDLAGASGKPRGLRWTGCDFDSPVAYARDRRTGRISAFVAVTIRFEAIEGGPMEFVEAVSNERAATAVFHYDTKQGGWMTEGRAVFNLNPTETIRHFQGELETA